MKPEKEKSEEKKCGNEACGCAEKKDVKVETKPAQEEAKLDPTHFGDWQVNCRTIDF